MNDLSSFVHEGTSLILLVLVSCLSCCCCCCLLFCIATTSSKYTIDLTIQDRHEGSHLIRKAPSPPAMDSWLQEEHSALSRGGGSSSTVAPSQSKQQALAAKKSQMAMAVAMKPGQQILMNAFMLRMSGSQLNIFSISTTTTAITSPLTSILAVHKAFAHLEDANSTLTTPKLVFLALNLVWLGIGLYKMSSMRLLPTTSADWTHRIVWKDMQEMTSIPPDNGLY